MVFLCRTSIIAFIAKFLTLSSIFFVHRTTVDDKMSAEETAAQYIEKLLDFHISTRTPPSQFLTWGNLTQCPALLMDNRLDGLDWDTIPGLFDHLNTIKATHIDLDIVTDWWMHESVARRFSIPSIPADLCFLLYWVRGTCPSLSRL